MKSPCYRFAPTLPRRSFLRLTLLAVAALATSAQAQETKSKSSKKLATVFQFSTLPALSLGLYDGEMSFGELMKHGDFGLGTLDGLDGELIILDGKGWRAGFDGRVSRVEKKALTPFAIVTRFVPEQTMAVTGPQTLEALKRQIAGALPTANVPYAIAIQGTFSRIKVRSVAKQSKPYPPLSVAVKGQSEWEWRSVRGTLVGFQFPASLGGVNLADIHFHFISDDKQKGGHLLDCELGSGQIAIQSLRGFEMQLPVGGSFDRANLGADQSASLKEAEQAGGK